VNEGAHDLFDELIAYTPKESNALYLLALLNGEFRPIGAKS
jgi:hypothetical protein